MYPEEGKSGLAYSAGFLPHTLLEFQRACKFTDLILACSDGGVEVHKAMLSTLFKILGVGDECEEYDKIVIEDVTMLDIEQALEDVYLKTENEKLLSLITSSRIKPEMVQLSEQIECKLEPDVFEDSDDSKKYNDHDPESYEITEELKLKILLNNPLNAKNPLRPKHIKRIQQLSCDQCDHIARDVERLETHKRYSHVEYQHEGDLIHHCNFCDFKTMFKKTLETHRRDLHPDWKAIRRHKRLACDECDFVGKRPEYLEKHKKREHGMKYSCDQCGAMYLDLDKLEIHRRSKHEKILHSCENCSYQSYYKSAVVKHFKEQHTEQMFYCDQCSYSTKYQPRIKVHVDAKHNGKRYYCEQCEYSAPYPGGLKRHIQMKHLGITYSCDFCEHKATTRSNLKLHVDAKHLGIKYSCDLCNYQASQPGSLKIHRQNQHGLLPAPRHQGALELH